MREKVDDERECDEGEGILSGGREVGSVAPRVALSDRAPLKAATMDEKSDFWRLCFDGFDDTGAGQGG